MSQFQCGADRSFKEPADVIRAHLLAELKVSLAINNLAVVAHEHYAAGGVSRRDSFFHDRVDRRKAGLPGGRRER